MLPDAAAPEAPSPFVPLVRVARYALDGGFGFGHHSHVEAQLIWGSRGVLRVEAGVHRWTLSPSQAAWIPGGVSHDVVAARDADLRCAYVDPVRCPPGLLPTVATVLDATPLVRELLALLGEDGTDDRSRSHAEQLLLGLVRPADAPSLPLRSPEDDRLAVVADGLRANPADDRSLEDWGRAAGASARTLARLFVAETGLTFAAWRTRLRIATALELLAEGLPVAVVAGRVGYAGPSAFVAAFRRETGTTPARVHAAA
ncbi:helix-turn-helix transcriptional regulator [Patulibacter sp. NPDC049589]|uniref:helix-turn-helix domain-containing protein n=1 Tax=Patulibacter sp. NPDC049589 TaxID=3154731 RepID=UPI00341301A9